MTTKTPHRYCTAYATRNILDDMRTETTYRTIPSADFTFCNLIRQYESFTPFTSAESCYHRQGFRYRSGLPANHIFVWNRASNTSQIMDFVDAIFYCLLQIPVFEMIMPIMILSIHSFSSSSYKLLSCLLCLSVLRRCFSTETFSSFPPSHTSDHRSFCVL